jgi:hypothetical protein
VVGARAVWAGAGVVYLVAAFVALVATRWLPIATDAEQKAIEVSAESAVAALGNGNGTRDGDRKGAPASGLERIATLLEEIEARREAEARRPG